MATGEKPDLPDHLGHRRRLRERFMSGGDAALVDYELLEIVLFQAIPRQDTKSIAKALLNRFGSYAGVLHADAGELGQVKGVGQSAVVALKSVAEAAIRLAREEVMDRPVLSSWAKLIGYLRTAMAHNKTDAFVEDMLARIDENRDLSEIPARQHRPGPRLVAWYDERYPDRFRRWAERGVFQRIFEVVSGDPDFEYVLIDGTIISVHQKASGAKGGLSIRPLGAQKAD